MSIDVYDTVKSGRKKLEEIKRKAQKVSFGEDIKKGEKKLSESSLCVMGKKTNAFVRGAQFVFFSSFHVNSSLN
jgi:hypothetical protein